MYYNKYRLLFTGAGSYDADAQAYFTAAGITDAGHKSAWNTFVLDCKANGNWTPLIAAYPVIGGTSGTHAINAKTPGTYNLTFTGITHSSSGITGNGTNNNVDTGIQPSTAFSSNINVHYCFYTSTYTVTSTAISDMGAFNSTNNFLDFGVYGTSLNTVPRAGMFHTTIVNAATNAGLNNGVWIAQDSGSNLTFYKNGGSIAPGSTGTKSALANLTGTIRLTCRANNAGTISRRSNKIYGFFSIGTVLGNAAAYSTAVQNLQTALGR